MPEINSDQESFEKEVSDFIASSEVVSSVNNDKRLKNETDGRETRTVAYFVFDPNILTEQQWLKLGLSKRQIRVISNYLSKGGHFYRKEDLKKIYLITVADYERLEPYIQIGEAGGKVTVRNNSLFEKKEHLPVSVELNTADSTQLETIKGVGPSFASRIIKYRSRLGGFYAKEQLLEVYGIDSVKYEQLQSQVFVDPRDLKKIHINTDDFDDMKKHPYLTYKQINAIIQYRKQHGLYSTPEDLKNIVVLNKETIEKIKPYLIF